ncbi:hypothetical protein F4778DRAFT_407293 [Xylariomycetidae sp. FL2044]|nr:hypothetical protein F4778DRAFT_407293 [Xylariomycetidae sp. FL2044]
MAGKDPLEELPAELVLRVLDFASLGSIAKLTRTSRAWHRFIDEVHQDSIYTTKAPGATRQTELHRYFKDFKSFTKYGEGLSSWKELCRRRTLLERSWKSPVPDMSTAIILVGDHPVWRFRPDFRRRIILSTSHIGGMSVSDMDSGQILWARTKGEVRSFAHLEYQDGTAVFDHSGNTVEVWKTDLPGLDRGHFRRVAILDHDVPLRGFQLSFDSLCVASSEGRGFVYDFPPHPEPPRLRTHLKIKEHAVGHLDQCEDVVVYSIGTHGYHFYDKTSGELLGHVHPHLVDGSRIYNIQHPTAAENPPEDGEYLRSLPDSAGIVRSRTANDIVIPLEIGQGPRLGADEHLPWDWIPSDHDEWGAGMLNGDTFVGISRGGRIIICSDWRRALRSEADFVAVSAVVECHGDTGTFDIGGWLHIHETIAGKRVIFESKERIYILALDCHGNLDLAQPALNATTGGPTPLAPVPVSFMGCYDDCIMSTYKTLRRGSSREAGVGEFPNPETTFVNTKAIRVLNFSPEFGGVV